MNKKELFLSSLSSPHPLLSDGAMGTLLHQRGISFDECFDELNLTNPALIGEIHREYIEAGSNIIQTNTFGANYYKLMQHGLEDKVAEINTAGVELAKRIVSASFKDIFIAGDIGPLGVRIVPFGKVKKHEARMAFEEQAQALSSAGVDLIIIETMTDLYETLEAIQAVRNIDPDLPIIASMTFTRDDRTLLGDTPGHVAKKIHEAGADIIGTNCSGGPSQILRLLNKMRSNLPDAYFSVMPNAGWPEHVNGRIMYAATPEYFADYALSFWRCGAKIIGGCCGTTPSHIAAMNKVLETTSKSNIEITCRQSEQFYQPVETDLKPTKFAQMLNSGKFAISVEMDPPRGLSTHKLLAGASLLSDAGADVINVADSPMARMRMSPWAVGSLIQKKIGIETVLHFPTRGRNLLRLQGDILATHAMDIRNIFVVMGDPTSIGDYPNATDNYDMVPSGLIKLVKQGFNLGVDHAGSNIGQPTSFFVGCALNLNPPNIASEAKILNRKVRAGADFLLTQPIYSLDVIPKFLEFYEREYGKLTTPILAGVLPLINSRHADFLHHEVPGIVIPENIRQRINDDSEKSADTGVQIAIELINQITSHIQGLYIMPAHNRYDLVGNIIESIKSQ